MCDILPAVLARDEQDFARRIMHAGLRAVAPVWHVDVLDGSMFHTSAWSDPAVIGTWRNLPEIELHVMSHNPLPHITAWHAHVPSLRRAIVHVEIARPLGALIERMHELHLEAGLALNPETSVELITHHIDRISVAQIMGVHPGSSGRAFQGDPIIAKLSRAHHLFPHLTLSVDGGVSQQNAQTLRESGAHRLVTSSALWADAHPEHVYEQLRNS